jgi:hypothetical protein
MSRPAFSRSTFTSTDPTQIALDSAGAGPGLVIVPGSVVRNIANLTNFDGFTAQELAGVERANALPLFPRFA